MCGVAGKTLARCKRFATVGRTRRRCAVVRTMAITPAELRHTPLRRSLFGYKRPDVDDMIEQLADAYQETWQNRVDMQERIETLETEVKRYREMEDLLRRTLVSAEKHAADQKEAARKEAAQIVREAEQEAREVMGEAHHQRSAVWRDTQAIEQRGRELQARYRAFLSTAEAVLDEVEDTDDRTEEREPLADAITMN